MQRLHAFIAQCHCAKLFAINSYTEHKIFFIDEEIY